MTAHNIDFWTLVEHDMARRRAEETKRRCLRQCGHAVQDIAAVILSLAADGTAGYRISEGTLGDLRTIAENPDVNDMDYRLSVIDAVVSEDDDPMFLGAVRRSCPQSYEYYRLWRHGLLPFA